jgi:hypothetical protein
MRRDSWPEAQSRLPDTPSSILVAGWPTSGGAPGSLVIGSTIPAWPREAPAQPQPPAPLDLARVSSSQLLSRRATTALPGFVAIAAGLPTAKPLGGPVRRGAARDPFAWGSASGVAEGRPGSPWPHQGPHPPRRCHTPPVVFGRSKERSGERTGSLIRSPTVLPRRPFSGMRRGKRIGFCSSCPGDPGGFGGSRDGGRVSLRMR